MLVVATNFASTLRKQYTKGRHETQHNDTQCNNILQMTLSINGLFATLSINDKSAQQHFAITLSGTMLSVVFNLFYAECHYAECCYADCRGAFKRGVL